MPTPKVQAPIDTDVKVPAAVLAASARASQIHGAAYVAPVDPNAPITPVEPVTPVVPAPEADLQPTNPSPAPIAPVAPVAPVADDWKHRYESMKGRHDVLARDNAGLSQRVLNMESLIATMATGTPVVAEPIAPMPKIITDTDIKDYGEDFIAVAMRAARQELAPELAANAAEITNLKQKLEGVNSRTAVTDRKTMHDKLDEAVPNWREVNHDENFKNWLALTDTYSGVIRSVLLTRAYEQNATPQVLAFFQGFLDHEAALAPRLDPAAPLVPAQPSVTKVPLEAFAAPGRAKSAAAAPAAAEKPHFTRAQVSQFYTASAAGKYRGREAEKDALEAQIIDASNNGRIIQ